MFSYVGTLLLLCWFLSVPFNFILQLLGRGQGGILAVQDVRRPAREPSSFLQHHKIVGCQRSLPVLFQFCLSLVAAISMLISPVLAFGNVDKCLSSAGALVLFLWPL